MDSLPSKIRHILKVLNHYLFSKLPMASILDYVLLYQLRNTQFLKIK